MGRNFDDFLQCLLLQRGGGGRPWRVFAQKRGSAEFMRVRGGWDVFEKKEMRGKYKFQGLEDFVCLVVPQPNLAIRNSRVAACFVFFSA